MKTAPRLELWSAAQRKGDRVDAIDSVHTEVGARNSPSRKQSQLSKGYVVRWAPSSPPHAPLNHRRG